MKRIIITTLVILIGFSVNAQDVIFGAKAGLNFATITGDDIYDVSMKTGLHIGAVAEIMFSDKFSFQPEIMYSSQGGKSEESSNQSNLGIESSSTQKNIYKLHYLNLPLMAKYYVADGVSLEAGPQIGFLLSSKQEYSTTNTLEGVSSSASEKSDLDDISSMDLGLNFGIGYKMDNGINIGARYNLGLSNINDFGDTNNYKNHNGVFQISVGYFFE